MVSCCVTNAVVIWAIPIRENAEVGHGTIIDNPIRIDTPSL